MPIWPLRNKSLGFTLSRRYAQKGFTSSRRSAEHGFTLIEMLVVLTVIGLIAAVAAQRMGHRPAGLIREEAEAKLDLALEGARREAGRTGAVQTIDPAALIPGATLTGSLPAAAATRSAPGLILVYPDGSSNGGVVTAGGRIVATIDWLTGEARDAS
jgi:prepilin-type N-terminal cleavage/methylation domain-containing protein